MSQSSRLCAGDTSYFNPNKFTFWSGVLCCFVSSILTSLAQPVDSTILAEMRRLHIPGLSAAKIDGDKIEWSRHYGYQDLEKAIPVTRSTKFSIASLSKTVTAAAIMQLEGSGYFKLDDDINRYLPFSVKNPNFPDLPITFRQLLRHRSSISDNFDYLLPFWDNKYKGPDIPLDQFLKQYLAVDGKHYDKSKNFKADKPGSKFEYSNVGYALLGYLVQAITKTPFDRYCQQMIFNPLGMHSASWFLNKTDSTLLAVPYSIDSLDRYQRQKHGNFPDYPAGQLKCNVEDLANFLICWVNDGRFNNKSVIDSNAVQSLTPMDIGLGFHTWFMYLFNTETIMYSHSGSDTGVATYMLYDPFRKKGLVILMNGELNDYMEWRKLIGLLYK
ncbi:MAG: serine hydrolase domain-containing protein [Dyadobacter sp.]|uniref:serine hydrolase domain-containing protein n=1 Tax=Dyadobacter sp. TaxID=1914288 RepID=UPI0032656394